MAFEPARPRHTVPFDGTEYDLIGTMELIEAVEATFREGIIQLASRAMSMGVTDTAKLFATVLTTSGYPTKARDVTDTLVNKFGVHSDTFTALQMHLYAFLRVTLEPPELREAMADKMGELLKGLPPGSPGGSTKSSA